MKLLDLLTSIICATRSCQSPDTPHFWHSVLRSINNHFRERIGRDMILYTESLTSITTRIGVSSSWGDESIYPTYVYHLLVRLLWEYINYLPEYPIELVLYQKPDESTPAVPILCYTVNGLSDTKTGQLIYG